MNSHIFIDIGNTLTKWKFKGKFSISPTKNFEFSSLPSSPKIWVSNVSQKSFDLSERNVIIVKSQTKYKSLINAYKDPKSLGSDRWLGMIASYELTHGGSFVFVDIGTAITIDVVSESGSHLGGVIFPGLEKIRQTFDFFPVSPNSNSNRIGQSTDEAWTIGTRSVIVNTINHRVRELKDELHNTSIILTGGGYIGIQDFLDFDHNYYENLVLDGLEFFANNVG